MPSLGILTIKKRQTSTAVRFWCSPVVSKKVTKSAVGRNTIKRRIREAARSYEKKYPNPPCVFVYARAGIAKSSFMQVQEAFFEAMHTQR